jgi:hypothetical protein
MTRMTQIAPLVHIQRILVRRTSASSCVICGQKIIVINIYATSQVADLPRPDRRDIDMVSIALKFSGIENDI